jgi:hypothetical protein
MLKKPYQVNSLCFKCVKYWYKLASEFCNKRIKRTFALAKYKQINYLWKTRIKKLFRRTLNPF